jgi:sarcosine oxidase/L-pipecolate oxidase
MATSQSRTKSDSIIIVGAGVFGLSTAWELAKRGYSDITVLDRFVPPVPDGSSVDTSRIIRFDYGDMFYGKLAREAVQGWKSTYPDHYHQCGFVMLNEQGGFGYTKKSQEVDDALGKTIEEFEVAADLLKKRPDIPSGVENRKAYYNSFGGWADAAAAIQQLATQCSVAGVSFMTGRRGTVKALVYSGSRVSGVKVADGSTISASQVILATGAWTNMLLNIGHATSGSGHSVGFIQLTEKQAEKLKTMPVVIHANSGLFIFPPTPGTNLLKIARHGNGFTTTVAVDDGNSPKRQISAPQRDYNNAATSYLPEDAQEGLRWGLKQLVPEFAHLPWARLRMCWYSDTPEGDFIVDNHPKIPGLFFATGGAGQ